MQSLNVVNCFRSLYLWVNLQRSWLTARCGSRCELLSFFVPLGEFTAFTGTAYVEIGCELLSFFVPLGEFTASARTKINSKGCELLSFFVPLGEFTANCRSSKTASSL